MGRPRLHDAETRTELLRAAEALVAKGGPDAVSVRGLAAKVGTTTRAIYSVFRDKDGLFRALIHESFSKLLSAVNAVQLTDDPLEDLIRAGTEGFRRYALGYPNLMRFVFEGPALRDPAPENQAIALEALQVLRLRVERCAAAGIIPAEAVDTVTTAFHGLCLGLASTERGGCLPMPMGKQPEPVWDAALRALVTGFAGAKRPAGKPWPRSEWPTGR
ncbi:MAG TPA: TetR/AcrR family transcriptional regulator [Gemmatimonadales bacterium]|nr:TetR/AcrR family transcriptional regulator [Gemmatimonadales bacterium]